MGTNFGTKYCVYDTVRRLGRPRVLVVGDIVLARCTFGSVERIGPEAPVPILRAVRRTERLGGAASPAAMLRFLKADVVLMGVIGDDESARSLRDQLCRSDLDDRAVLSDTTRVTTVKHRYMGSIDGQDPQQMFCADFEHLSPFSSQVEAGLLALLEAPSSHFDIILVIDPAKGVCTPGLLRACVNYAHSAGIRVLFDPPRRTDYTEYAGCSCIMPDRSEAACATGSPVKTPDDALLAGAQLLATLQVKAIVITLGRDGIVLAHRDGRLKHFPSRFREIRDVTAERDMVLSVLGLSLASGLDFDDAIALSNLVAAIGVEQFGAAPRKGQVINGGPTDEAPGPVLRWRGQKKGVSWRRAFFLQAVQNRFRL